MTQPPPPPPVPPPPGWQPGWQPGQPRQNNVALIIGLAIGGVFAYVVTNVIVGFIVVSFAETAGSTAIALGAITLVLLAFGGGGAFIAMKQAWSRGFGMGLMIGWALVSIFSVGFCTGLHPSLYQSL